jgi:hypothetical protein
VCHACNVLLSTRGFKVACKPCSLHSGSSAVAPAHASSNPAHVTELQRKQEGKRPVHPHPAVIHNKPTSKPTRHARLLSGCNPGNVRASMIAPTTQRRRLQPLAAPLSPHPCPPHTGLTVWQHQSLLNSSNKAAIPTRHMLQGARYSNTTRPTGEFTSSTASAHRSASSGGAHWPGWHPAPCRCRTYSLVRPMHTRPITSALCAL